MKTIFKYETWDERQTIIEVQERSGREMKHDEIRDSGKILIFDDPDEPIGPTEDELKRLALKASRDRKLLALGLSQQEIDLA